MVFRQQTPRLCLDREAQWARLFVFALTAENPPRFVKITRTITECGILMSGEAESVVVQAGRFPANYAEWQDLNSVPH